MTGNRLRRLTAPGPANLQFFHEGVEILSYRAEKFSCENDTLTGIHPDNRRILQDFGMARPLKILSSHAGGRLATAPSEPTAKYECNNDSQPSFRQTSIEEETSHGNRPF
jgi:hypothetical protein